MEVLIARGESVHQLHNEEEFPSGQREQTVNLSLFSFGGSNPPSSTICVLLGYRAGRYYLKKNLAET